MLVMADQIGSPLHRHRHDSGVDGSFSLGGVAGTSSGSQIGDAGGGQAFFHAVNAIRASARPWMAVAADDIDVPQFALAEIAAPLWPALAAPDFPQSSSPPALTHRPHLSLPPHGRAPPRHA
ncbi:MAG: hypothetical protein Q8K96_06040 [Rubrivivax sp.]|nr:hypothetical protein [Rubrivivax sp.]